MRSLATRERLTAALAAVSLAAGLFALIFFALTDDITSEKPEDSQPLRPAPAGSATAQRDGASEAERRAANAIAAILDDDRSLPSTYVAPHPGADGLVCSELSCWGNNDDRRHVGDNVDVPICTPEQIAQKRISNPLCYPSNPPTSGPHSPTAGAFRVHDSPLRKENAVHSMEHGAVVVWYNTSDQAAIDKLKGWVEDELGRGRPVVMTKYTGMEAETIALTAWTRLDKFPASTLTEKRVKNFIEEHNKRFNPEGF